MKRYQLDNHLYPEASHHKKEIESVLEIDNSSGSDKLNTAATGVTLILVCFTNRCGSNLFTDLISQAGIGIDPYSEPFNSSTVLQRAHATGIRSFTEYFAEIIQYTRKNDTVAAKIGANQLFWLANSGILEDYFDRIQFVKLNRTDKIAQAVSLQRAYVENNFILRKGENHQSTFKSNYDEEGILRCLRYISDMDQLFEYFFSIHGVSAWRVRYEDMLSEPVARIREFLIGSQLSQVLPSDWSSKISYENVGIVKQADAISAEFCRNFRNWFYIY